LQKQQNHRSQNILMTQTKNKYISLLENSEYDAFEAANQSSLKKILIHPNEYITALNRKKEVITKPYLVLGSLVDCLIFEKEQFDNNFILLTEKEPPNQINKFITFVIENEDYIDQVDLYKKALEFSEAKNRTVDYFKEQMNGPYGKYTIELRNSKNKTAINNDMLVKANQIISSLNSFEQFANIMTAQSKKEEVIYQPCIVFYYKDVLLKAKLDCIKIQHDKKRIIPSDLKTTYNYASEFKNSYIEYEYDFQSAFYTLAINYFKEMNYPDYSIEPFKFVVESTSFIGSPLAFEVSQDSLEAGLAKVNEAIEELTYCKKVNNFKRKRIEEERNKLLTL
jgi:hypothetical protein